ncbi:hypothetical protein PHMEG_00014290 [Phytophthora megakarya]|uniref:Uncharacterized protein n=1 Tax=Phytophthora megakarya TaxID=4795 RepID=A0A225W4N1_9STRA|nr:hypothetical protein PHMEG_00014290 [Phytophthora megakarya]
MCAYDPSDRIKISTVVDEIAAFAKPDKVQSFDVEKIISQEQIEQMKLYCCLMNQDRNRCSSTQLESQVVLSSMYGIFWDRIQNLYAMPNADSACLQPFFNLAWVKTQKLKQNPSTLAVFTEMAIDGYALHSDMDKVIEANFWLTYPSPKCLEEEDFKRLLARTDVIQRDLLIIHALVEASRSRSWAALHHLIENDADVDAVSCNDSTTPLMHAVRTNGNLDVIRFLVDSGANVNVSGTRGETSLMYAAENGNEEVVRFLVAKGADINAVDYMNRTALIYATWKRENLNVIRFLVGKGANVDTRTSDLSTPLLHICARYSGELNVVEFLVDRGADFNAQDTTFGETPLMRASRNGRMDIVEYLVEVRADVNSVTNSKRTSLLYALEYDHLDVARFLVENGADIEAADNEGWTPLMIATQKNNFDAVRFLVESKADVNAIDQFKQTSLMHAIREDNLKIISILVHSKTDVNALDYNGSTTLSHAVLKNNSWVISFLVENGADVNALDLDGWMPVMFVENMKNSEIVRILVDAGANTNDLRKLDLMAAVENGNLDGIRQLLSETTDINLADVFGTSLLMSSVEWGRMNIVQLLLDSGADVNAMGRRKHSPLLLACKKKHWDDVHYLVDREANVNATDDYNCNALLYAAKEHCWEVVRFLIGKGAIVSTVDKRDGLTPLIYAAEDTQFDIIRLFVDAGGDANAAIKAVLCYDTSKTFESDDTKRDRGDIIRFLVGKGADVNTSDHDNKNLLMHTIQSLKQWGDLPLVKLLVDKRADVNAVDKTGCTSLIYAAEIGNLDVVRFLLDNGADVSMCDNDGRTATFVATNQSYTNIPCLLVQHIPHVHQPRRSNLTQMPANCFISPFAVALQQLNEFESGGGNYRSLWLDAEVAVKKIVRTGGLYNDICTRSGCLASVAPPKCDLAYFFVCEWASNGSLVEYLSTCKKRGEQVNPW